ncbi:MAG: hypothetical protein KBT47_07070, partial [Armatimonadetes bacterium]|nr:hypothetical protein [Candidatus Hippobium faecium]
NERGIHMGVESIFYIQEEFNEKRTEQLKEKYKNIASLKKAWKVRGDFVDTIEEASVLYPVYNLGDELLLSDGFDTDKVYVLEGSSVFWYEYLEMRDMAYVNAQNDMIDAVKEKMDVPVTIKMVISGKKYNVNYNKSRKGFDAAGFELYNTDDLLMNYGVGYRYGEMLSSFKAGFAASTEINKTATENMYPNYPDIHSFFYDMSVTHMFGAKLTYLFLLDLDSMNPEHEQFPHNRSLRDQRMLEWMKLWEEILNDKKELIENYKPYVYNSWPQADCTWPQYSERDAVRSVDDAYGTANVKAENGVWVINTQKADVGCDITFVTLNNNPGVEFYKDEFNKLLSKKGHETVMLGLRYNLGDLSVDKYYKNEFFEDEEYKYQVLNVPRGAEVIRKTEGKVWGMKIGNLQIVACEPKYCNSIEDSIQFAKVPKPKTDMPYNAKDYAEKLLGIKFATFGNNHYKAVGYTLKGKDEVLIHTTKKEDRDILRFTAPKDFILEQYRDTPETLAFSPENAPIDYDYPSLKKESREYKKGDTVEISFPITPVSDENVGAGKGSVRFVGLSLDDIEFENTEKDSPFTEKNETFGISGLAEGLTMPKAEKITDPGMSHTEAMKAMVAHNRAIDLIEQGKYQKALDLLREFQGCAQPKMLESYYLLLGTACLYLGYPYDAVSYFGDLLRNIPGSQKVKCALGCAYWNTDREKAVSLWKETSDLLESQANLEFANNQ